MSDSSSSSSSSSLSDSHSGLAVATAAVVAAVDTTRLVEIDVAGETVRVPAALLATADEGSVLAAMAEAPPDAPHYVNCDPTHFRAMLEYLRHGAGCIDWASAKGLHFTASMLGVDSLARLCDEAAPPAMMPAVLSDDDRTHLRAELDKLGLFIMSGEPERPMTCGQIDPVALADALRWAKTRHAQIDALLHPQLDQPTTAPRGGNASCSGATSVPLTVDGNVHEIAATVGILGLTAIAAYVLVSLK
ncbi:BTB domain containing protein [Pandoravirus quercus]|uniref:BTB domain containing protein n=2 Tax=Pandoravirus TaxID=2060084 RepID=A0A2U7U845_9VIRU|nr:BTB domain containing protein [Pandoravirus quercus]AVK74611.1 BTB domain containing protein [Pandoravirus quercus]QBZ80790.1 BTB domain containing protein [Pandoravirus celtis]